MATFRITGDGNEEERQRTDWDVGGRGLSCHCVFRYRDNGPVTSTFDGRAIESPWHKSRRHCQYADEPSRGAGHAKHAPAIGRVVDLHRGYRLRLLLRL